MTYLDALQDALAAEHAALFLVGYLGAQTSQAAEPALYDELNRSYSAHRLLRDALVTRVQEAGGDPVAAAAAYDLDDVGSDPARIRADALALEQACSATYGFLVANSPGPQRRFAIDSLIETALREVALGGEPRLLPGR